MLDIVAGRNAERNTAERKQPDEREEKQEKNEADPGGSTRRALSSRLHDCHTGRTCGRLRTKIKPPVIDDDIARMGIGRRSRHSLIGVACLKESLCLTLAVPPESGLDILQTDSRLERVLVDWTGRNPDSDFRVHYRRRVLRRLQLGFLLICLITHSIIMHECAHYDGSTDRGIRLEACF